MVTLDRFIAAQQTTFTQALEELRAGEKRSHWMWFIFPQIKGLGRSSTARYYAISGIDEAKAYLAHPVLGPRLAQCTDAVLGWAGKRGAEAIFGHIDTLKFASSMTLFEAADGEDARFGRALETFFGGQRDAETLAILESHGQEWE